MFGLDGFEINKIAGAILASVLAVFAINEIGNILVHPTKLEQSAYIPDGTEQFEDGAAPVVEEDKGPESAVPLLASADVAEGEKGFRKCVSCHSIEAGGGNGTGPALHGIVGKAKAQVAGFSYSNALAEMGGVWSYENLDAFLRKPKDYVKGTKMSFAGIKKPEDRAEVIAYLAANTPNAPAFPAVEAAPAEEAATMVEEAAEGAQDAASNAVETADDAVEAVEDASDAAMDEAKEAMDDQGGAY